jgi:drug/metabolite transporter (DMT)-like permease
MFFASLGMLPILTFQRLHKRINPGGNRHQPHPSSLREGLLLTTCGSVVGPFLGMWMSLVALDRAPMGVAQTLCCLQPILILPFAHFIHKEHIGARGILGALLAVGGATVLFLAPQ